MNKNTINSFLLILGILFLSIGSLFIYSFNLQENQMIKGLLFFMIGIFLISKQLSKTKDLPSKKYKEQLNKKEANKNSK